MVKVIAVECLNHGPVLPRTVIQNKLGSIVFCVGGKLRRVDESQHYLYQGENLSKVSFIRVLFFASGSQTPELNTSRLIAHAAVSIDLDEWLGS